MTTDRENCLESFRNYSPSHSPMDWHIWKKAYHAGYMKSKERYNKKGILISMVNNAKAYLKSLIQ